MLIFCLCFARFDYVYIASLRICYAEGRVVKATFSSRYFSIIPFSDVLSLFYIAVDFSLLPAAALRFHHCRNSTAARVQSADARGAELPFHGYFRYW